MAAMNALCVFCGSSSGGSDVYREQARAFGEELGRRRLDLVWGGAKVGLMGVVADAVLAGGRLAIGVIPGFLLDRELAYRGASELLVVDSMHERKAIMASRSDGFVLLPGGLGSFEEFFEVYTWAQIGLHRKPIGVLNVAGYFDPLLELLRHASREGFVRAESLDLIACAADPAELLDRLDVLAQVSPPERSALGKT